MIRRCQNRRSLHRDIIGSRGCDTLLRMSSTLCCLSSKICCDYCFVIQIISCRMQIPSFFLPFELKSAYISVEYVLQVISDGCPGLDIDFNDIFPSRDEFDAMLDELPSDALHGSLA